MDTRPIYISFSLCEVCERAPLSHLDGSTFILAVTSSEKAAASYRSSKRKWQQPPPVMHPFRRSVVNYTHPATASYRSQPVSLPRRELAAALQVQSAVVPTYREQLRDRLYAESFRSSNSVRYPKFSQVMLDEAPTCGPDHKFADANADDFMRDQDGQLMQWPWLQQHAGQVWCAPSARPAHPLDHLVNLGLDNASADGNRGRDHTAVRAWFAFMADVMHSTPHRPMDTSAPLWAKLNEEWLFMQFACALLEERQISLQSVRVYCSAVQGWHAKEHGVKLAAGLKLERLPQMLKGLRRTFGDPEVKMRRGLSPQLLRKAMDKMLDPSIPAHANLRAALAVATQGLLRSAEYSLKDGTKFNPKKQPCRSDLVELNPERMVLMISPCKNMRQLSGKTSPLVIGAGGLYLDAVAEVYNLRRVDPVQSGCEAFTPMFRDPATNKPISYSTLQRWIKDLMVSVGENPDHFSTHSARIGGATALFAAGADETVIRG